MFIYPVYNHNLRNISTIYIRITRLATNEIFSRSNKIHRKVGRAKDFGHHYAHHQELKSIIQWLVPVVFGAVVFKLLVWCGAEGYVCRMLAGLLNMFRAPLCPSSGAQVYYTVVAACCISCCGFQVAGLVWS
jgi:hypothetical protein